MLRPRLKFCANLSFLFADADFPDRFVRAAKAGFRGVEYMFPYAYAARDLAGLLREHRLTQVLHNLPAGNWDQGERGIACLPGREAEFCDGLELAIDYARTLGCRQLNCLAGLRPDGVAESEIRATFLVNLRHAARRLGGCGIRLLVEPINSRVDMPGFWLDTPAKALALMSEAKEENLWLQYDVYHAQIMEDDLLRTIEAKLRHIAHFQVADAPGRHEPGSGGIDYPALFSLLEGLGYQGWIGCEYRPQAMTEAGLGWAASYLGH